MKVKIHQAFQENTSLVVGFSSEFGSAEAVWNGQKPLTHNEYQVEVDIEDTLSWDRDVVISTRQHCNIGQKKDAVNISGYLCSVEQDGYAVLSLGDNIVAFMAVGNPPLVGSCITLSTKSISLTPVEY